MKRTHGSGELNESNIGNTVTLCGWLHRRRDHGGLTFFDLRDRSGLAQVVLNAKTDATLHQQAKGFGPEYVLRVTGTVEVQASTIEVLNPALTPPFEEESDSQVAGSSSGCRADRSLEERP